MPQLFCIRFFKAEFPNFLTKYWGDLTILNSKCEISVSTNDEFYWIIAVNKTLLKELAKYCTTISLYVERYNSPLPQKYILDKIVSTRNANAFWECLAYSPAFQMSILKHDWSVAVADKLVQIRVGRKNHGSLQSIESDLDYLLPV